MARGTAEQWRRRIADQRGSGLSIAAFCRRHSLTQVSFNYWKRRLREEPSPAPARFLPVSVTVLDSALTISIQRGDGLVLRVPCDERGLIVHGTCGACGPSPAAGRNARGGPRPAWRGPRQVLCWAHARRKFLEAKESPTEAHAALAYIARLYALEG